MPRQTDPLSGRSARVSSTAARPTDTCPLIIHAATVLEMWEGRQSLGFTDTLGLRDVADPANVRTYVMTSTQHASDAAAAARPRHRSASATSRAIPTRTPGPCVHCWTALTQWVRDGEEPPPGAGAAHRRRHAGVAGRGALPVDPGERLWRRRAAGGAVPRRAQPAARVRPWRRLPDRRHQRRDLQVEPPEVGTARYGGLVPQVDVDGNDVGGVRAVYRPGADRHLHRVEPVP